MSSIPTSASAPPSPSLMSFGSSGAASALDSTELALPAVQDNIDMDAKAERHPRYYFKDGNILFVIEDVLYNVHRYFFERDSAHFRSILESAQGADEHTPIVLPDVSCSDFDEFLAILYPTDFRRPTEKPAAQWTAVLHLAAKWGFESIRLLAIDNLTASTVPVDKIVLGRRCGIATWLPGAYEAVCTRADPLTVEEGMKLGMVDVVRIAAARQAYGCANISARYKPRHLSGDLGDIFGLEKPTGGVRVGSADVEESEESAIKILEAQVAEARAEFAAFSAPPSCARDKSGTSPYCVAWTGTFCDGCPVPKVPESDARRLKREDKEDKERRLKDLERKRDEKRDAEQRDMAEKQERMSLFR